MVKHNFVDAATRFLSECMIADRLVLRQVLTLLKFSSNSPKEKYPCLVEQTGFLRDIFPHHPI